jgi:hypothetical protein
MLSAVQKARVMVGVFMDESGECEQILRAVFDNATDEGRRMIWRMHQFVYTDARAVSALQRMSVLERVVYENNRRALHLRELKENNAEACLLREMERSGGDRYVVQGQVLEVPPWAVEELRGEMVGGEMRVASAREIGRAKSMERDKEEALRRERSGADFEDCDLYWDDVRLWVTVREMERLVDVDSRRDEPGFPRSVREAMRELAWVFSCQLQKGETFLERQARYRRSASKGMAGGED